MAKVYWLNSIKADITKNGNVYLEGPGKSSGRRSMRTVLGHANVLDDRRFSRSCSSDRQSGITRTVCGVPEDLLSRIAPVTYTLDVALLTLEGAAVARVPPHEPRASACSLERKMMSCSSRLALMYPLVM